MSKRVVTCAKCGDVFETTSSRAKYCKKPITKKCVVCGREFETQCYEGSPDACSRSCASQAVKLISFKCAICGESFHPNSSRQRYCKKPITKVCKICGDEFESFCGDIDRQTCSKDTCKHAYAHNQVELSYMKSTRICAWCKKEFHPRTNTQRYCENQHYKKCAWCGRVFPIIIKNTADIPNTCSAKCKIQYSFRNGNPMQIPEAKEKQRQTMLERYGVEHPFQSSEIVNRTYEAYKQRTGYSHPSHNPEVRSRTVSSAKKSKLELRVAALLDEYKIGYVRSYMISNDFASHEFDFYIPDYKCLVDCDGVYYHSYMSDPDGKHVLDYYDEDRIALIPKDHIFQVIVEGDEDKCVKELVDMLKKTNSEAFSYDGYLFDWCRSIEFPYPEYPESRMKKDYSFLCKYNSTKYNPLSRLGDSIIQQFHKSIYDAHVGKHPSPKEAWYDDKLLRKVILNRLIYKNDVDPFKILKGFNISKICPRVSIFNPILAKHIITAYLNEYAEVFDPFSGFSGRMLGTAASGKKYIGQDLNVTAVEESNQIIDFLKLKNCSVKVKNILEDSGGYECLMTCPPYYSKETYSNESEYKTCDEWIDLILNTYRCKRYVFVVDKTEKYTDKVVEEIKSTSHFNKTLEYIVLV